MPFTTYIQIALYILTASAMTMASAHLVHMLQLEGYKNNSLIRWILGNAAKVYVVPTAVSIAGVFLTVLLNLFFTVQTWIYYALVFLFVSVQIVIILFYARKSRILKAKKPLAITSRVKRLFGFISIFYVAIAAGLFLIDHLILNGTMFSGIPVFILMLFIACGVLAANFMALPVEAAVRHWYLNDARRILSQRDDLIRIGITGSYGKTSCKFILGTILSEKYNVLVPPSSYNTPMGLTRVIREQLKPAHEVFLAEMGARHAGDIKELGALVKPKYGLITSVGPQHLETFGSLETIAKTKYELIESLSPDGCAFFPADNEICRKMYEETRIEKLMFAVDYEGAADVRANNIRAGSFGSRFDIVIGNEKISCETRLLGKHNISNILGCACVARKLGLSAEQIRIGIRKIQPVEHRLQLMPKAGGITVIDDAFNANPSGVRAAMDVLSSFEGRKIVVTPGMVELGTQEKNENFEFGRVMAKTADLVFLIGPKHTQPIYDGLIDNGFSESAIQVFRSLEEASRALWSIAQTGDVVIFENDLPDNYDE